MSQPASWAPVATTTDPGASATSAPTDVTKLQSVAISGASQPTGYQSTVPSSQNISAQKKHTNRKLAIGLGVGLAVGVAALAFLIALFAWRLGQREDPRLSCAELNGSSSRPISELPHELPLPTIRFELADPAVSGPPGPDTRHELCAGIVESSEKIDWI
ncbi:MAG: hypothetical protein M1814_000820 [Vezdaea aestivalis]|nr:MAG: hypothetical protein M1814_000820 [Vezdaea aestivalis]